MRIGGASARPRPLGRLPSGSSSSSGNNGGSLLPSTRASPTARGVPGTRSQSLAGLLRRLLIGCGALYVLVLWYSGVWGPGMTPTARPQSMIASEPQETLVTTETPSPSLQALEANQEPEEEEEPLELLDVALADSEERVAHGDRELNAQAAKDEPVFEASRVPMERVETLASRSPAPSPRATEDEAVEGADQYEFMEEIQQQLEALDKKATAAVAAPEVAADPAAETVPTSELPAPTRSLSPREVFHARLKQGEALTAQQAVALQKIDQAARLAKQREAKLNGPMVDPKDIEAQRAADEHAKTVKPMPRSETKRRRLKCIGWRATENCDPNGKRVPSADRSCVRIVDPTHSGYCEVEDRDSGERFRVMMRSCDSLHAQSRFRCFEAWDFSNFAILGNDIVREAREEEAEETAKAKALGGAPQAPKPPVNGVLIVIYPKLIPSAFAIVRSLRTQNCSLPIEFWYRTDELSVADHPTLQTIARLYGPVEFRTIEDQRATGFATKISAIQHSRFDNVLFLDADNFPVRDPTYLFELPEFKKEGAIFWPDFWHPDRTIFNIHARSLLWQLVDMDFVDMFEQESGQLLIDRRRSRVALALMQYYSFHRPNHFEKFRLAHGDKDLFRLAWLKTNTSFHFIQHPPGVAGKYQNGMFCGMTMVQSDPNGDVIFLHRNAKKLEGRKYQANDAVAARGGTANLARQAMRKQKMSAEDPAVWTHLLLFKPSLPRTDYTIDIYEGKPAYPVGQWCYGKKTLATPHFNVFEFEKLPYADLETRIRAHAVEATELVRAGRLRAAATAGGVGVTVPPSAYE